MWHNILEIIKGCLLEIRHSIKIKKKRKKAGFYVCAAVAGTDRIK